MGIRVDNANDAGLASTNTTLANEIIARTLQDYYQDSVGQYGGYIAPSVPHYGNTTITLTAGRSYYQRFVAARNTNTATISYVIQTAAGSNDNVDVGIYSATTLAKVASSGATASKLNGTATRTSVTLVAALTAGTAYYAAISYGTAGSSAPILIGGQFTSANSPKLTGLTNPGVQCFYETVHPLPETASITGVVATCPILFVE